MLDRRSFLLSSIAIAAGKPNQFERLVATTESLDWLGHPRSWSLVCEGYHPISPERVIVMTEKGRDGLSSRDRRLKDSLRASLSKPFDLHSWCGVPMGTYHIPSLVPAGKLDLIFRLMRVMTDYYRVPQLFPKWATMLAKREALASTGLGNGFGLLHQFQDDGLVEPVNAPLDWWLFLFPGGIEWGAGEPVFAMIGHVFPAHHRRLPGLKLRAWELASRVGMGRDDWASIADIGKNKAARIVNQAILLALQPA